MEAPAAAKKFDADAEVIAALMGLGYTQAEASDAAARLPADGDLPLEERVRMALAAFSQG